MNHEHHPQGRNIRDYSAQTGKRWQWARCQCGAELRRETLPESERSNWTDWETIRELGRS